MKTNVIQSNSVINNSNRFDAGFHLSEGVSVQRAINNLPYTSTTVGCLTEKIFYGIRANRKYVFDYDYAIPFLTGSSILQNDFKNIKLVSKKYTPGVEEMTLDSNWILITRSGTVGQIAWSNKLFKGKYGSEDIIRVIPKEGVYGGYIYAYLASKYGQALLTQGTFGAVVQHIEPSQISSIPIPKIDEKKQKEIHDLILKAAALREEAQDELNLAEKMFFEANNINLSKSLLAREEANTSLCRVLNKKDISVSSFKALNYSSRSKNIIECLKMNKYVLLKDYLEKPFYMGVRASFKRIDQDKNGEYIISQSDIHRRNPKNLKKVKLKQDNPNARARRATLIMPSAGTLGENEVFTRPLLIRSNFEGMLLSEVVGVLECKTEIEAAYLQVFLSSKIGFRLLRTMASGTNLMYPMWPFMKEIPVPICNSEIIEEIGQLVLKAYDKNGESNKLENTAIHLIEDEIEKWNK